MYATPSVFVAGAFFDMYASPQSAHALSPHIASDVVGLIAISMQVQPLVPLRSSCICILASTSTTAAPLVMSAGPAARARCTFAASPPVFFAGMLDAECSCAATATVIPNETARTPTIRFVMHTLLSTLDDADLGF